MNKYKIMFIILKEKGAQKGNIKHKTYYYYCYYFTYFNAFHIHKILEKIIMKALLEINGSYYVPAAKSNFEIFNIVNLSLYTFELAVMGCLEN